MLPAAARLHTPGEFASVTRGGRRAASDRLVVHARCTGGDGVRAGLVVSKKVGNSVTRHRVSRRLRAVLRQRLGSLPAGTDLVIRALPSAGAASSAELAGDLDSALRRALERRRR